MSTWDFLGNAWAVELLQSHLQRGEPRHAYLITGPEGVGRRTLALAFAQALNCQQPPEPGAFCGECRACTLFARMQHPDLSIIEKPKENKNILVEQVRELQHSLSLAPYEANYRIALLLDFENANENAQNALLKTLEEPSERVIMLLTAESAEVLLPTIVSRCEVLRLRPVSLQDMVQGLSDDFDIPEYQISLLAHVSGGRPGYAVWLSQNPEALKQRKDWLDDQQRLLTSGRVGRFAFVDDLGLSGGDPDKRRQRVAEFEQMLQVWLAFWRDVLLKAAAANAPLANPDREAEIENLAQRLGLSGVRAVVASLERTLSLLRTNANTRLVAEVLMLDLPILS